MKKFLASLIFFAGLALPLSAAEELTPIEPEMAHRIAKLLADEADKIDKPQIKVTADSDKANGLHVPHKIGVLVVPQKELRESEELAAMFKTGKGASLAYLFLYNLVPVIDGQPVAASRLHTVEMAMDEGAKRKVHALLLAVRQVSEDDYRLHVYGPEEKPLLDVKFSAGAGSGAEPVGVEVKDVDAAADQGKVVLTVFGKYQAGFTCGHKAD